MVYYVKFDRDKQKENAHIQTNDGLIEFKNVHLRNFILTTLKKKGVPEAAKQYLRAKRGINPQVTCGLASATMLIKCAGYPDIAEQELGGVQLEDLIGLVIFNGSNRKVFKGIRDIDWDEYPGQEVPQYYSWALQKLYEKRRYKHTIVDFSFKNSYEIMKNEILENRPVMFCAEFPATYGGGHYAIAVGVDTSSRMLFINDPYKANWNGKYYHVPVKEGENIKNLRNWKITVNCCADANPCETPSGYVHSV